MVARLAEDRFMEKVMPEPNSGCWLWMASLKPAGYGQFGYKGNTVAYAHRVAYELFVGPIPDGMTLDHKCRVRSCVNPAHLEPVFFATNILRGVGPTAVNSRKTHCKRGHEFTEKNTYLDKRNQRVCRACWVTPEKRAKFNAWRRKRRAALKAV